MNKENVWKDIADVQETIEVEKLDLKFGFDDNKEPVAERFELLGSGIKVKYEPIKYERKSKTIAGIEGFEETKRKIYLTEIDEYFPLFKKLAKIIKEGHKPKINILVRRMETKDEKVFYKMFYDGVTNMKLHE